MTTLGYKQVGSTLNVESDMLVKYVERILGESGLHRRDGRKKVKGGPSAQIDAGGLT